MYMQNRNRLIDIENKLGITKREEEQGKGTNYETEIQGTIYSSDKQQGYTYCTVQGIIPTIYNKL